MRYLAVLLIMACASCGMEPERAGARAGTPADFTKPLLANSDVPLEWSGVARRGDTLIVAAAKGPEVWQVPLDSGKPTRLFEDVRSGLAIAGMAVRGRDIGLHRLNGDFTVVTAGGDTKTRHLSPEKFMTKPLAVAARSNYWLTGSMVSGLIPGTRERRGRMIVERIDDRGVAQQVYEELHWSNDELWSRAFDLRGVTFNGDSVLLSGIEPPRIVIHALSTGETDTLVLQGVPQREMAPDVRREMERSFSSIPDPVRKQLVLPRFQPPVVQAWPYRDGIMVMAYGPSEEPILDWYCEGRFRRTLIEDPTLTEMFRAGDDFVTVAEGAGRDYELRLYRIANLNTSC